MNLQRHHQDTASVDLQENCIYLARDGTMRSYAKTAELFRSSGKSLELMNGRTLVLHYVNNPHDVHYPIWEMHPEGDELLILAFRGSGSTGSSPASRGRSEIRGPEMSLKGRMHPLAKPSESAQQRTDDPSGSKPDRASRTLAATICPNCIRSPPHSTPKLLLRIGK